MTKKVDVAILGAGSAGLFALSQVRKATDSWVLIDGGELGTTCARVGCMPSKVAIQIAEDIHRRDIYKREGIEGGDGLTVNLPEAMEHIQDLRDIFVDKVLSNSTDNMSDEFMSSHAQFIDKNQLQVGDVTIEAKRIIIATGSTPVLPEAWKNFGDRVITTDEFFELEELPHKMAVIGLGVIGLELGQSLHRLGVNVVGIDQLNTIGGLQDPEANTAAQEIIGKDYPLWLGARADISEMADGKLKITAGENEIIVDKVLACMGRTPNVKSLNLDVLNVKTNDQGVPEFNPNTMQVGDLPIYLAGDVTGDLPILHEAADEGRIAGHNATRDTAKAFARKTPLGITFCDPNIVTVGQAWNELDQDNIVIGEVKLGMLGRALIMGKNRGLLRVYGDKHSGQILGATFVAPGGEHLGHLLCWSIELKQSVFDLLKMPFYHPTLEEGLQAELYDMKSKIDHKTAELVELRPLEEIPLSFSD